MGVVWFQGDTGGLDVGSYPYVQKSVNCTENSGNLSSPGTSKLRFSADVIGQAALLNPTYSYPVQTAFGGTKAKWHAYWRARYPGGSTPTTDFRMFFMSFTNDAGATSKMWQLKIHFDTKLVQIMYDGTYLTGTWAPTVGVAGNGTTYHLEWVVDNSSSTGYSQLFIDGASVINVSQNGNGGVLYQGSNLCGEGDAATSGSKTDSFGIIMDTDHDILYDNGPGFGQEENVELLVSVTLKVAGTNSPIPPLGDSATYNAWTPTPGGTHYTTVDEAVNTPDLTDYLQADSGTGDVRQTFTRNPATSYPASPTAGFITAQDRVIATKTENYVSYISGPRTNVWHRIYVRGADSLAYSGGISNSTMADATVWPVAVGSIPWTQALWNTSEPGVRFVWTSGADVWRMYQCSEFFCVAIGMEPVAANTPIWKRHAPPEELFFTPKKQPNWIGILAAAAANLYFNLWQRHAPPTEEPEFKGRRQSNQIQWLNTLFFYLWQRHAPMPETDQFTERKIQPNQIQWLNTLYFYLWQRHAPPREETWEPRRSINFKQLLRSVFLLSFDETLDMSETLSKQVGKNLSEAGDFSETFNKQVGKNISEDASLGESITRQVGKIFGEEISITEGLGNAATYLVSFSETLTFTESFSTLYIPFAGSLVTRTRRRRRGSLPGGHSY